MTDEISILIDLQLLVDGIVPWGSGLSSSSALVVAVAIAILGAYGCTVPQPDVAAFTCDCERHVGVASGGMDQAISVMARLGALCLCIVGAVYSLPFSLWPDARHKRA
jgi:galactokinase